MSETMAYQELVDKLGRPWIARLPLNCAMPESNMGIFTDVDDLRDEMVNAERVRQNELLAIVRAEMTIMMGGGRTFSPAEVLHMFSRAEATAQNRVRT